MKRLVKKLIPKVVLENYYNRKKGRLSKKNIGHNVECSICKSKFKYFDSYGVDKRQNARCVSCGSLERDRLLWKYFNEKSSFFTENKRGRVLHFAPEKVFYGFLDNNENIEYFPCDLSPNRYNFEGKSKVQKADITKILFEDNYFDFIICNHVLEHIPDDKLAMTELFRVMKKGATAILQVPIAMNRETTYEDFSITEPEEREKAFGQSDHVRWYGLDYKDRLVSAGFTVEVDDFVKSFTKKEIRYFGFMPTEHIYKCSK